MRELMRIPFARMQLEQVRDQLLDAAAFGKYISPESLEHPAGKISEGLRIYTEATQDAERAGER
ncbi:DUF6374 family protein [Nocardia sp. NPDC057440]|uniref:DUF6374 family protein n=1 Tax=Nocardia sp. NPDC057440 TaxID=3346134 RepID=UPI0036713D02